MNPALLPFVLVAIQADSPIPAPVEQTFELLLTHLETVNATLQGITDKSSADRATPIFIRQMDELDQAFQEMENLNGSMPEIDEATFKAIRNKYEKRSSAVNATFGRLIKSLAAAEYHGSTELKNALKSFDTSPERIVRPGKPITDNQTAEEKRKHLLFMQQNAAIFEEGNGLSIDTAIVFRAQEQESVLGKNHEIRYCETVYPTLKLKKATMETGADGKQYYRLHLEGDRNGRILYFDITAPLQQQQRTPHL